MPDPIPTDDLYARLGVTRDADTPAIDRAWRALLKQHHPDVAGAVSLELAKRINVAHDWLAQADRRARYDAAVRQREGHRATNVPRRRTRPPTPPRRWTRPAAAARPASPPDDLDDIFGGSAPAVRSFLAQAAALTVDDIDRLSVTEAVDPISELRDLIPPELWVRIEAIDARVAAVTPRPVLADPAAVAATRGCAHAIVLELFLWYYLADPEPLLEQMRRGWESAVGLPRYGPNTEEVARLIERLARATPADAARLAASWQMLGDPRPWPEDAWEFDFAALEVSAALARRDAAAVAIGVSARHDGEVERWSEAFASTAHVATLRPIFSPRAYARYGAVTATLGPGPARRHPGEAPRATVRRARC